MPWTKGTGKRQSMIMTPVLIPRHTGLWSFNGPFILVTTIPEAAPSLSLPPVLLYRNQSSFKKSILCQETAVQSLLIVGQGGGVEIMQEQDWRLRMREGHLEGWWWKTQPIRNRLWSHIKGTVKSCLQSRLFSSYFHDVFLCSVLHTALVLPS